MQPGTNADAPLVPQFDFTSCQGVIFVLLMTLFFSGLILAILLPFQYVSFYLQALRKAREAPAVYCSLLHLQGKYRAKAQ